MKFAFVAKHRHVWPVSWICAALRVSRSGFHAWLNRPASARSIYDEKLSEVMRLSFQASDRTRRAPGVSGGTSSRKDCPAVCIGSSV